MQIYRQGDVLIIAVAADRIPAQSTYVPRDAGRIVLAYGEVTGHSHAIVDSAGAVLLATPDTEDRFLRIMSSSGVELRHEEHDTVVLPTGDYLIRIQREYMSKDMPAIRVSD